MVQHGAGSRVAVAPADSVENLAVPAQRPLRPAPDLERFLSLLDGRHDIRSVVEESGLEDLMALENLNKLYSKGMLEKA